MFAPAHHQATRFVVPVRRELAVRTIFNLLGPLTNPAGARRQLIGVSDPSFLETIAGALARLGVDRALVVAGEDGLDEISIGAPTRVVEVERRGARRYTLTPGDVGHRAGRRATLSGLRGWDARRRTPRSRARDPRRASPGGRGEPTTGADQRGRGDLRRRARRDDRRRACRPRARRSRTGSAARGARALRAGEPRATRPRRPRGERTRAHDGAGAHRRRNARGAASVASATCR